MILFSFKGTYYKRFFLIVFLFFGFLGCEIFPEPCGEVELYFDVTGVEVYNRRKVASNHVARMDSGEEVDFDDHSINLDWVREFYSQEPKRISGNSLYARSPCDKDGYLGTNELLDTVIVTTLLDFDDQHLKGAIINDLLIGGEYSLTEILARDSIPLSRYGFGFGLSKIPEKTNAFQISVYTRLENGEEYESTSDLIYFK